MKNLLLLAIGMISLLTSCKKSSSPGNPGKADSVQLTVVNGYGSGRYLAGDTVDIWSTAIPDNAVFNQWSGVADLLQNSGEWHNQLIMPYQDVTITGNQKPLASFSLKLEQIKGVHILKNVYYYFPVNHKGVVFLNHGSNGSAANLVNNFEWRQMIKDLVSAQYAIIVTEAEEVSLNTDLDGDGSLRWAPYPMDSTTNVDFANIKAIRDTFYARGYTQRSIPLYAIGMSNGGAFTSTLTAFYKFQSGVSYCAQGYKVVFNTSTTPLQFCMAKYDNSSEVGAQGDADALTYNQLLTGRGTCSKYFLHDKSPLYPERFARSPVVSMDISTALFSELKKNQWLDGKNYLTAPSDNLPVSAQSNPSAYPVFSALNVVQQQYVEGQVDDLFAAHQFFSDFNKTTIRFLDIQCQ